VFDVSDPRLELPAGTKEQIFAQMMAHMPTDALPSRASHSRFATAVFRFAPAAAALILLAFSVWWIMGSDVRTASADLQDVIKQISKTKSVSYDITWSHPAEPAVHEKITIAFPGRIRAVADDKIQIQDALAEKTLILNQDEKLATLAKMDFIPEDHITKLKNFSATGKFVGTKNLNGQEVQVYRVSCPDEVMDICVDQGSNLPVRMEVISRTYGNMPVAVLKNFKWDEPVDDTLFSMDIPVGYTLRDPQRDASPERLVQLLRFCAERHSGRFPEQLNNKVVVDMCFGTEGQMIGKDAGHFASSIGDATKKLYRSLEPGLAFINQMNSTGSWRYMGSGKSLGDGSAPIAAWKAAGVENWTVLYGDLQYRDISPQTFERLAEAPTTLP